MICASYFIFSSIKKQTDTLKMVKCLNYCVIICYLINGLCMVVESIILFTKRTNFLIEFQSDPYYYQWTLQFAGFSYLVAKFFMYFVFYYRCLVILKGTAYNYTKRTYSVMKYLIWFQIVCGLSLTALLIFLDDSDDQGIIYFITILILISFFILDMAIPATLTIMVTKKTYEIGKMFVQTMSTTDIDSNAGDDGVHESKNTKPKMSMHATKSFSDSDNEDAESPPPNSNHDQHIQQTDLKLSPMRSTSIDNSGSSRTSATTVKVNKGGNTVLKNLFEVVSKIGILCCIISFSSILFFIVIGYFSATGNDGEGVTGWLLMQLDSTLNVVCLVLQFEFANKWYLVLCNCLRKRSMNWIKNKALSS